MAEHEGLFGRFLSPPKPALLASVRQRYRARTNSFSTALVVSIVIHACLGLALILVPVNLGKKPPETEQVSLRRAVEEMAGENPADPEMEAFLAEAGRSGLLNDLGKVKIAGTGFVDGMKTEVFKAILKASLAARGKSLADLLRENPKLVLPDGSHAFVSAVDQEPSSLTISVLPKKDLAAMEEAARLAEVRKTEKGYLADGSLVRVQTPKGDAIVPSEYFFRTCPYEKILSWGAGLFFFSAGFPLDLRGSTAPGVDAGIGKDAGIAAAPAAISESGLIRVLLVRRPTSGRASAQVEAGKGTVSGSRNGRKPSNGDFAAILDKLMPLAENEQVTGFVRDRLDTADPDASETAALVGAFFQNNLNSVIFDLTDLAAGFDCLEELYFNKALAFRIADLWNRFRETKTGTECLFYFASQYDFERRALERLFAAQAEAEAFLAGRSRTAELFEKERKSQVVRDIGRKVLAEMKKKGYAEPAEVLSAYRREQERIYRYLIGQGGEARDRGLFALGCYYWDFKRYDLAVRAWMEIRPSHDNAAFKKIRVILSGSESPERKILIIDNVLKWEDIRGSDAFLLRLVKFGKWRTRGG